MWIREGGGGIVERYGEGLLLVVVAFLCTLEVTGFCWTLWCLKVSCLFVLETGKFQILSIITVFYKVFLMLLLKDKTFPNRDAKQLRCWRNSPPHQKSSLHQQGKPCLQLEARSLDRGGVIAWFLSVSLPHLASVLLKPSAVSAKGHVML